MKKSQIRNHINNPYRFFEKKNNRYGTFSSSQRFHSSGDFRKLKLAWAFQGLLGKQILDGESNAEYVLYHYEPYLTTLDATFQKSLARCSDEHYDFYYDPKIKGHWATVDITSKHCSLSKSEKSLLLKHGYKARNTDSSNLKLIVDLERALEIAGNADSSNFRIISRLEGKTDIFSALCNAFEIPDSEEEYYRRDALRTVFTNNGPIYETANEWLEYWVEDNALKTHLSCFMEKRRGLRDRRDIFLSHHYHKIWNHEMQNEGSFPFGLEALNAIENTTCLLGWEWEHVDLPESKALVRIKNELSSVRYR